MKSSTLQKISDESEIRMLIEQEIKRTGGIFRLTPTWVGRPGIIQPGRRLKLYDEDMSQMVTVNERWLASVTFADNGVYNQFCPKDHGLSYLIVGNNKVLFRDAVNHAGDLLLDGKKWDVLPKFFDNRNRIPHHLHPCDDHVTPGLLGKPESYYFPIELNLNKNEYPLTPIGVDSVYGDEQILNYLQQYLKGDNRLTDLSNSINLIPGTGFFMPPCTLHAPGSLVTYELQVSSDVTCIPESRVNDMIMPPDLFDRDLPYSIEEDGINAVCEYVLSMIRCHNSGNSTNFRKEYFRPPVKIRDEDTGSQSFIIYRCGKASQPKNPDLYSAKRTIVKPKQEFTIQEKAAFGGIVIAGHGIISVAGKDPVEIESTSLFLDRDQLSGDEFFVTASAAKNVKMTCNSIERLSIHQHFASNSNPEACSLSIPEFILFST